MDLFEDLEGADDGTVGCAQFRHAQVLPVGNPDVGAVKQQFNWMFSDGVGADADAVRCAQFRHGVVRHVGNPDVGTVKENGSW